MDRDDLLRLVIGLARKMPRQWTMQPEPGDLVVEVTNARPYDPDGIGTLVAVTGRQGLESWDVRPLRAERRFWRRASADVQRWENATFVGLPEAVLRGTPWEREPAGEA